MATQEQIQAALARANEYRLRQSEIKAALKAGSMTVPEALEEPAMGNLWLSTVLRAQDKWGRERVLALLSVLDLGESKPVRTLTARQRRQITQELAREARIREAKRARNWR